MESTVSLTHGRWGVKAAGVAAFHGARAKSRSVPRKTFSPISGRPIPTTTKTAASSSTQRSRLAALRVRPATGFCSSGDTDRGRR
jgi:hypothetical protein